MKIRSIDTIHFGLDIIDYYIKSAELIEKLKYLKELGIETRKEQFIELNKLVLTVELSGARFYSYRLTCKDFTILLADKPSGENPPIKVNFSSDYLWSYGYKQAYKLFIRWFENATNLKINNTRISRLDICCDSDEVEFNQQDIYGLVTYSKTKTLHYADDVNFSGRKFTGITIGRGKSILCRIYDKTEEIKKSGKEWFYDIWKKNNWKSDKTVWRVEFQLRRKVLKEFGIDSVEDSFNKLDGLWKYLTYDWLTIRNSNKNIQPSRWKIKTKWQIIQSAFDYEVPSLVRKKIKKGNLEKLKAQAGGLLISIGAAEGTIDINNTLDLLRFYLNEKLKKNCKNYKDEVINRSRQYLGGYDDYVNVRMA